MAMITCSREHKALATRFVDHTDTNIIMKAPTTSELKLKLLGFVVVGKRPS
eukprot:SAG31_NODE_74_length_27628_cov_18.235642_4_plen_51_part_00